MSLRTVAAAARACPATTPMPVATVGLSPGFSGRLAVRQARSLTKTSSATAIAPSDSRGTGESGSDGVGCEGRSPWRAARHLVGALRALRLEAAPLGLMAALPVGSRVWSDLLANEAFVAGFWGWLLAQVGKIFTYRFTHGKWRLRALLDSGGMPSSHSSLCVGVTTSVALQHGFRSSAFALGLAFSLIVMYDAAGVRRHAGKQAEVLNKLLSSAQDLDLGTEQLKEVLGHTPLQVVMGCLLGIVTACVVHVRLF